MKNRARQERGTGLYYIALEVSPNALECEDEEPARPACAYQNGKAIVM